MKDTITARMELICDDMGRKSHGPIRIGVPFSRGHVMSPNEIHVVDREDTRQPIQRSVLGRWPDDSIRWCLLEFIWDPSRTYFVSVDRLKFDALSNHDSQPLIELSTSKKSNHACIDLTQRDVNQTIPMEIKLQHDGQVYFGVVDSQVSVDTGPIRWSHQWDVRFVGKHDSSPLTGLLIANTYADFPVITFEFVVRNPQAMNHPGGNWDLGATGSVIIDDLSVRFALPDDIRGDHLSVELSDTDEVVCAKDYLHIFQASSGGENWDSKNHIDRSGNLSLKFRGYNVNADGIDHAGLRAEPTVRSRCNAIVCAIDYRDFWQNFPKSLAVENGDLHVGLFPSAVEGGTELQGGEQKTHQFAFELQTQESTSAISICLNPPLVKLAPIDYSRADALPYLVPRNEISDQRYESLVNLAIEGHDTLFTKSETIDQFGWRNFGDLYGDHEAVYHQADEPMISHDNNQYDCTLGFAIQFLRHGDRHWFDLMTHMADHAWDIDTYHTNDDKLLYNNGLFWHTYHYADAHTSTHRSYPRQLRVSQSFEDGKDLSQLGDTGEKLAQTYAIGGGPAAAHNYSTGWMIAYWITGVKRYRTAAIAAADYVIQIEDGRKTPFKWLSGSDTGFSTCSSDGYYGPGRAAANSTLALLTGHELTGDDKYLEQAASLMRRTVHPQEDLDSQDLLNAELRWFYTMYLQALGRLVDYKDSIGQRDNDFNYGVAVLLHYARWMAKNERPTLSAPEQLQYPTETWAAQDIRKWHILQHATLYECDPQQRKTLKNRADFFFDDVCESLSGFATRSLCRPVIIMLNFGWQQDWFLRNPDEVRMDSSITTPFDIPLKFVPQRTIAIRRFKYLVTGAIGGATLAVVGTVIWLVLTYMKNG